MINCFFFFTYDGYSGYGVGGGGWRVGSFKDRSSLVSFNDVLAIK